ncbi:hypothetical protein NC652_020053 [Populus alba x Populus x berolinensis]|nr:hypothetical protein NC652_020053 [Populus alba x Populus x berolinensis]
METGHIKTKATKRHNFNESELSSLYLVFLKKTLFLFPRAPVHIPPIHFRHTKSFGISLKFPGNQMGLCFPSTPKKLAMTIGLFASGAALFALGLHQCYVNIAPQRARVKARNDFVRERLRKKYGKE